MTWPRSPPPSTPPGPAPDPHRLLLKLLVDTEPDRGGPNRPAPVLAGALGPAASGQGRHLASVALRPLRNALLAGGPVLLAPGPAAPAAPWNGTRPAGRSKTRRRGSPACGLRRSPPPPHPKPSL